MECPAAERRFVQALIQAAVAVYHFERGNHTGAARLFRSGRAYMEPYRPAPSRAGCGRVLAADGSAPRSRAARQREAPRARDR